MAQETPDVCENHDWDQTLCCKVCGTYKHDHTPARFSGGAGVRTHPLSDEDYRREMRKLGGR